MSVFEIQSVAVPLLWKDYFTTDNSGFTTISSQQLLQRIVSLGANDIRLVGSYGSVPTPTSSVFNDPETSQSVASLKTFTDAAHAAGIAITWCPITHNGWGTITGDPTQTSYMAPANATEWFANWRIRVLDNARIAEAIGAERFQFINDIEQAVLQAHPELTDDVVAMAAEIRTIYSGDLTCGIFSPDGNVGFFSLEILQVMDLVGISVNPKLTIDNDADLAALRAGWHAEGFGQYDIIANLERLSEYLGKPIWNADFAPSSYDGSNTLVPAKFDASQNFVVDEGEQALAYEALFREFRIHGGDWFKGLSIQSISRIVGDPNDFLPPYLESPVGENFWGKLGEGTIRQFFSTTVAPDAVTLHASDYGEQVTADYAFNTIHAGRADQTLTGNKLADVFISSAPGKALYHELKLNLTGFASFGIEPEFEVRVNGERVPIRFSVPDTSQGPTDYTIRLLASGKIDTVELALLNWGLGDDQNRNFAVSTITLDGIDLMPKASYFDYAGTKEAAFQGFTWHGGRVVFDTASLTLPTARETALTANLTIDGREGMDTVVYAGTPGQYTFGFTGNVLSTVTKPGAAPGQGVDHLTAIEVVRFDDGDYSTAQDFRASAAGTIRMGAGESNRYSFGAGPVTLRNLTELRSATGSSGQDVIVGGAGANVLVGNAGNDTLSGGDGNDTLSGGAGDDILTGGTGTDTASYSGVTSAVTVTLVSIDPQATGGAGKDTLRSIENVVGTNLADKLTGNGVGNALSGQGGDDLLTGNAGNDRLNGGTGADRMFGGAGNDTYFVDDALDRVYETLTSASTDTTDLGGKDTVTSSIAFKLGKYIENLALTGSANIDGSGNELANQLVGNDGANRLKGFAGADILKGGAGNDTLYGGDGRDTLTGGTGKDSFVFDTAPTSRDTITDFSQAEGDKIQLSKAAFAAFGYTGALRADDFYEAPGAIRAQDASDKLIYNTTTGVLYYDPDGTGATAAVPIALLGASTHPALVASDLAIVV